MKSNKKSAINKLLVVVIGIPIIMAVSMLGLIGVFEIGEQFIIEDISNITQDVGQQANISPVYITKMQEAEQNYKDTEIPYDLYFLSIFILAFGSTVVLAFKSEKMPVLSFLGMTTIGFMILLLITFFLDQFMDYWVNDFFYFVFDDVNVETPFMDWFVENLSLISGVWFAILLFLLQLEIDVKKLISRESSDDGLGGDIEE
jgi:hypothetical protein